MPDDEKTIQDQHFEHIWGRLAGVEERQRDTAWTNIVLHLAIANLLVSTKLVTTEQVCARIDDSQRRFASNAGTSHAGSASVSGLLKILKDDIMGWDLPTPPKPSPKIGLVVDNTQSEPGSE
jgi:hypothetical protein